MHAAGACWNNRNLSDIQPPNVQYWNDGEGNRDTVKTDVLSRYAFAFALENSLNTNYVTEKRYQALAAGAVRGAGQGPADLSRCYDTPSKTSYMMNVPRCVRACLPHRTVHPVPY